MPGDVRSGCAYHSTGSHLYVGHPYGPALCTGRASECVILTLTSLVVPVVLAWQFAKGDVNSCNTGVGFGSSQGNTNSNANSQSTYYCAATSTDGPGCQALCQQYEDGGISEQPSFKCKSWVLVVPYVTCPRLN